MKEQRPKQALNWQVWFPLPILLLMLVVVIYTTRTNEAEQTQDGNIAVNASFANQATPVPTSSPTLPGPQLDATKQAWLDNEQKRRDDAKTRVAQAGSQPSRTIPPPPTPRPQPTPGPGLATCMGGEKSVSLNSCYGGWLGDEFVYVAAGALRSDTSQGAIEVYTTTLSGKIGSPFIRYSSPQKEGSLVIAYVDMPRVTLIAPQDNRPTATFVFNLETRQWEGNARNSCQIYPIAFSADTFSGIRMRYDKKQVPLNIVGTVPNTRAGGAFAWLSFTRAGPVKNNSSTLSAPGEGVSFINSDNADDHRLSVGDWIQGQETIDASLDTRNSLDFLETSGFIVPVALWDQARGQGTNLQYHISGFAWVYVAGHTSFPPVDLSVAYWGPATCSDK